MRDSRANLKKRLTRVDSNTFLTTLYVIIDDFCKSHLSPEHRGGAPASLTPSEVLTLALFGQWQRFSSERELYRYAQQHLRGAAGWPVFVRSSKRSMVVLTTASA